MPRPSHFRRSSNALLLRQRADLRAYRGPHSRKRESAPPSLHTCPARTSSRSPDIPCRCATLHRSLERTSHLERPLLDNSSHPSRDHTSPRGPRSSAHRPRANETNRIAARRHHYPHRRPCHLTNTRFDSTSTLDRHIATYGVRLRRLKLDSPRGVCASAAAPSGRLIIEQAFIQSNVHMTRPAGRARLAPCATRSARPLYRPPRSRSRRLALLCEPNDHLVALRTPPRPPGSMPSRAPPGARRRRRSLASEAGSPARCRGRRARPPARSRCTGRSRRC